MTFTSPSTEPTLTGEAVTPTPVGRTRRTLLGRVASSFAMFRNAKSLTGLAILGVFVLVAVFSHQIARYDPTAKDYDALKQPPSGAHWLGTTHMGEDVYSQLVYGTRGVLVVGFTAAIIATLGAIVIGVTSGYLTGWRSEALSAVTNVFLVIPALPLIIIVASQYDNPSLLLISSVIAATGWAWGGRVLRAQTMSLRNRDFVQAARANGERLWRVIAVEMLPNLSATVASSFVGTLTAAILSLTTLAFVGVIPITTLNWGTILFWAQQNGAFPDFWWWYVPAGLCIALLGTALALINFGIDEYVNPRLRSAGERARALRKRGAVLSTSVTEVRRPAARDHATTDASTDPSTPAHADTIDLEETRS